MTLNYEQLLEALKDSVETEDAYRADCENVAFLLDHCEIAVPAENRFFVQVNCGGVQREIYRLREAPFKGLWADHGLLDGIRCGAYTGNHDFGHTSTCWDQLLTFGIYGLYKRVEEFSEETRQDPRKQEFYENLLSVYQAVFRFLRRAAECARSCGKAEMADGILHLISGSPRTMFEAMQTVFIYYTLQQMFDGSPLRTLGRLDGTLFPYYVGREQEDLFCDFLTELDRIKADANLPFALGGTDAEGKDLINELSYFLLDCYTKLSTKNIKLHLLCSKNTPKEFVCNALDSVREGKNSIVFLSDEKVIESLIRQGADPLDAAKYHVVGCYECCADQEVPCSCSARVNIPKALELALNGGADLRTGKQILPFERTEFKSFSDLYDRFVSVLQELCRRGMKTTDLMEAHYKKVHASPIYTSANIHALRKCGDVYADFAAKYNNSSLNAFGLATAVDSLVAIRKLVYEDHTMTLTELIDVLRSDWEGRESLRLLIRNRFPKYGNGDPSVDVFAGRIADALYEAVGGVPNAKGGIWRLGLFSINWRWEFGAKTAASADGRRCGEPLSQNSGATFGSDREGATAHLSSVCAIDASKTPNGTIADLDLHASSVKGENGLKTMYATLKTYFEKGGFAVHYNVLDTEVLKAARKDPSAYPNLQVRLCGWNVLFATLSDQEKDEFIARSMKG
ncbi:MAG: hypothetical protein IJC19_08720 [Clostridia bacterium]|nr:hypothetical protein [Clostridia bacterium]